MARSIVAEATVRLRQSPDELWPYLADTNRFNRAVGLPAASYSFAAGAAQQIQIGEFRFLGWAYARWIEHPFEWQRPYRFAVVRDFLSGPLRQVRAGSELTPVADGTEVHIFAELTPRNAFVAPFLRYIVAPRQIARARAQYEQISAFLRDQEPHPYPSLRYSAPRDVLERLRWLCDGLVDDGANSAPVAELKTFLAEATDEEVAGMRPLELARRWGTDPRQTLEAFLRAATAGLLVMRWELLCPSCRGVKASANELRHLANSGQCSACNLHFTARVDEAIEARFYPDPSVRTVSVGTYCVGGPMNTPHRVAQIVVEPGEARNLPISLPAGGYIVRSPQSRGVTRLHVVEAPAQPGLEVRLSEEEFVPESFTVSTDSSRLLLRNLTEHRATVAVDDESWSSLAATPGRLMTFPAFQSLFSAEALAPGVELAVGRVGLLFTDLAGSTALYERAGDAIAFRMVSEHFTILQNAIEQCGGALIKTIGDAVMAAFPNGADALEAALALQRDIRRLDTRGLADSASLLKVGVHAGACFVVTLNDQLDYFGTTVNVAARAQGEAHGGEIVMTESLASEATDRLAAFEGALERFEVTLRGLSAPVRLVRLDCRALG